MNEVRLYGGGESGLSAYEEYVLAQQDAGGPVLDKEAWLASLRGPAGVLVDPGALPWEEAKIYAATSITTEAGSSWCARRATQGERPSESPDAWEVFVQGVNLAFADQTKAEVAGIGAQKVAQAAEQATAADMARAASQAAQSGAEAAALAAAGAASAAAASAATLVDGTAHASVDTLMVAGFQYSQLHFESLEAFEAAHIPDWAKGWTITRHIPDLPMPALLDYVRDDAGLACVSANGVKGSPAAAPHALHYGLSAPAIMRMLLDIDRGEFKYPHDLGEDLIFDKPIEFRIGSFLNIAEGATATFRRMIYAAPDEWILRGPGNYSMEAMGAGGVNARHVWATWGGVRSAPDNDEDMAPYMSKLCGSVGGTENVIQVLHGRYALNIPVDPLPRGTWIKCAGERRTVWSVGGDGFDVFTTGGEICRFSEMNFELGAGLTWRNDGAFIRVNHPQALVEHVRAGPANLNIDINGDNSVVRDVSGFWGPSVSADSSLVRIRKGYCSVVGVRSPTTTSYAPAALVHIGGEGAGGIDSTLVDDVFTRSPGVSVLVDAANGHIRDVQISNLRDYITAGAPEALVKLRAGGGVVENVRIDNWRANSRHVDAIVAHAEGANITALNVGQGRASGSSGAAVKLVAEAGRTISGVLIGDDADIYGRATPILKTGLGSIAKPTVMPINGPARMAALGVVKQVTLADQSVYVIPMGVGVFNGSIEITTNQFQTPKGKWAFRAGPDPYLQAFPNGVIFPEKVELSTSEMTGTNGTDEVMTVSATSNGTLYVQNRLRVGNVSFCITILQGIANFEFP